MNPRAPIQPVHFGATAITNLLDVSGFSLERVLEIEPQFLSDETHAHDDAIHAFAFTTGQVFDADRLQAFFRTTLAAHGPDLLRYKGIVAFAGIDHRVVLQGVHMLMNSDLGRPWGAGERRASTLVFIGRNLPEAALRTALDSCLLP